MSESTFYRVSPPSNLIFRDEGGDATVEGMVVPFNEWVEIDNILEGHFLERFSPGSLKKTFSESMRNVKGRFEHGRSKMFERAPIMEIQEAWETSKGAFFRANLLDGLPGWMIDGLRRGLYGASIGAEPVVVERTRRPQISAENPNGLEERTYRELRAYDISLTPSPTYESAMVVLRSITDELVMQELVKEPERLLELLRSTQEQMQEEVEAEPTHSEPEEPEAEEIKSGENVPLDEPKPEPEQEGSRVTQQPTKDYLSDEKEETWQL